jgi:hypothetical protein
MLKSLSPTHHQRTRAFRWFGNFLFLQFNLEKGKRFCTTAAGKSFLSQYVDTAAKVTSKGKFFFVLIYSGKAKRPPQNTNPFQMIDNPTSIGQIRSGIEEETSFQNIILK